MQKIVIYDKFTNQKSKRDYLRIMMGKKLQFSIVL